MARILIVEDEKGISDFLKEGLTEEKFVVETAFDGVEGLQKILNNSYDVILMDWMLPKMQGVEVTRQIREAGISAPVIFLTARDTVQDTILGLRSGANDYLKKPFSFDELLERIRVQLRQKETSDNNVYTHRGVKINQDMREAYVDNQEIHLTQKEFDLLLYLIKNKNKVCTRDEILDKVWDIHFEYDSGVIDVYINALRKKIKAVKDINIIETVRGVGYIVKD